MTIRDFPLILIGVFLNAGAQLLLKEAMVRIGYFAFNWQNVWPIATQVLLSPFIWLGFLAYAISIVIWLLVLSRVDVTIAYPMVSIGYIITAVAAYFVLQEPLTLLRIAGIAIILLGVFLLTRPA